jgi:hypothetical protein
VEDVVDITVGLDVLERSLKSLEGALPVEVAFAATAGFGGSRSSLGFGCGCGFFDLLFFDGCLYFFFLHVCVVF